MTLAVFPLFVGRIGVKVSFPRPRNHFHTYFQMSGPLYFCVVARRWRHVGQQWLRALIFQLPAAISFCAVMPFSRRVSSQLLRQLFLFNRRGSHHCTAVLECGGVPFKECRHMWQRGLLPRGGGSHLFWSFLQISGHYVFSIWLLWTACYIWKLIILTCSTQWYNPLVIRGCLWKFNFRGPTSLKFHSWTSLAHNLSLWTLNWTRHLSFFMVSFICTQ